MDLQLLQGETGYAKPIQHFVKTHISRELADFESFQFQKTRGRYPGAIDFDVPVIEHLGVSEIRPLPSIGVILKRVAHADDQVFSVVERVVFKNSV